MATTASNTGVAAYDCAFQASLGQFQSDCALAAQEAQQFSGQLGMTMTTDIALRSHLQRVIAAGRLNGVNVDGMANQLRQQFCL